MRPPKTTQDREREDTVDTNGLAAWSSSVLPRLVNWPRSLAFGCGTEFSAKTEQVSSPARPSLSPNCKQNYLAWLGDTLAQLGDGLGAGHHVFLARSAVRGIPHLSASVCCTGAGSGLDVARGVHSTGSCFFRNPDFRLSFFAFFFFSSSINILSCLFQPRISDTKVWVRQDREPCSPPLKAQFSLSCHGDRRRCVKKDKCCFCWIRRYLTADCSSASVRRYGGRDWPDPAHPVSEFPEKNGDSADDSSRPARPARS